MHWCVARGPGRRDAIILWGLVCRIRTCDITKTFVHSIAKRALHATSVRMFLRTAVSPLWALRSRLGSSLLLFLHESLSVPTARTDTALTKTIDQSANLPRTGPTPRTATRPRHNWLIEALFRLFWTLCYQKLFFQAGTAGCSFEDRMYDVAPHLSTQELKHQQKLNQTKPPDHLFYVGNTSRTMRFCSQVQVF